MKTVITYGTFDLFHQGHYNILKRAKAAGDYLIVGVTGESYDIERGKLNVRDSLPTRIQNVLDTGFADKIIIEEYEGQKINDIIKYDVDILVIGSDWLGKFDYLKEYCEVRYLERTRGISSTQIRSETGKLYRVGLVTDAVDDGTLVNEARYVSGVHVESVYSERAKVAKECVAKYELAEAFDNFDTFLNTVDVVYIHAGIDNRARLATQALTAGKHVICDSPISLQPEDVTALYGQATEAGLVFAENVELPYLRAFTQLIWQLHGGAIGSVDRIEIKAFCANVDTDIPDHMALAVYAANKLLNTHEGLLVNHLETPSDCPRRRFIAMNTPNQYATIELSGSPYYQSGMAIYGSEGIAYVPDDWWNMGFFEIRSNQYEAPRRYSFNFEGSGMRYLLQEYLITIASDKSSSPRFTEADSQAMLVVLNSIERNI